MKVFYFGCYKCAFHYMRASVRSLDIESRRAEASFVQRNPWGYTIDSGLCPAGPEIEGQALIHHKDGWTAMSFWDRSVDRRGKCNSNFLAEGTWDFDQMRAIALTHFPEIMARYNFAIVPAPVAK